jgi:hypothetical protein
MCYACQSPHKEKDHAVVKMAEYERKKQNRAAVHNAALPSGATQLVNDTSVDISHVEDERIPNDENVLNFLDSAQAGNNNHFDFDLNATNIMNNNHESNNKNGEPEAVNKNSDQADNQGDDEANALISSR